MTAPARRPIRRLLIANRGEIACRIIRTAHAMGIHTIAVHSDADAGAAFVTAAREAWRLGPAPAADSYLRGDLILEFARRSGADAIHPGYGFLSENAAFAEACEAAGILFVGPPAGAIAAMGSKSAAKRLMEEARVPLVPGYHGDTQDAAFLQQQADAIGYPVLIKACSGGGGKGMRIVEDRASFAAHLASCQREAAASFGDDSVLIERYLTRPRHVEIQVFADHHGHCIYLAERDCSVQRRHQKVLEEAPAPGLPDHTRRAMGEAACAAARAVGYVGAGTVEFIMDADSGAFFFMEMNTRLQVEHPVTEMITGQDLVAWQLKVAAGEPLPLAQDDVRLQGHAIEARIYAEDPDKGFLPATGTLHHLRQPDACATVRIDSGVREGDTISPWYDPMIAKLIVWGEDRDTALARMATALSQWQVAGVVTNLPFLHRIVTHPAFAGADLDTGLIARHQAALLPPPPAPDDVTLAVLAFDEILRDRGSGAWQAQKLWRLNGSRTRTLTWLHADTRLTVTARMEGDGLCVTAGGHGMRVHGSGTGGQWQITVDGHGFPATVVRHGRHRTVFTPAGRFDTVLEDPHAGEIDAVHGETHLRAPMPGRVVALLAECGARVTKGTPLLVLEAMKMEHTLNAPADGVLRAYHYQAGEQVQDGCDLAEFEAD